MFYNFLKIIVRPIFFLLYRVKLIGGEHAKYEGGMMLISNHVSATDPIFMHLVVKPKVYFMAKEELFKNPLLRAIIKAFGAFPVNRGKGDMEAIKTCFKLIKQGRTIGIFPEGTRSKTGELLRFQPGVSMIAVRTHADILPVYLDGKMRIFHKNYIVMGAPFNLAEEFKELKLSNVELMKQSTEVVRGRILALKEQLAQCKSS